MSAPPDEAMIHGSLHHVQCDLGAQWRGCGYAAAAGRIRSGLLRIRADCVSLVVAGQRRS
jgi:hypothetical protein